MMVKNPRKYEISSRIKQVIKYYSYRLSLVFIAFFPFQNFKDVQINACSCSHPHAPGLIRSIMSELNGLFESHKTYKVYDVGRFQI